MGPVGTQEKHSALKKLHSPKMLNDQMTPQSTGTATKSIKNKHLLDHKFDGSSKGRQAGMHTLQSAIGFNTSQSKGLLPVKHDQETLTHENRHIHNLIHTNQQKSKQYA